MRTFVIAAIVAVAVLAGTCGTLSSPHVSDRGEPRRAAPPPPIADGAERDRRRVEPVDAAALEAAPTESAALRVVVRREGGAAVAGANVVLLASLETDRPAPSEELAKDVTDKEGIARLPFNARGFVVHAWTDDAGGVALLGCEARAGQRCAVTLRPAPARSVEIVDPNGHPVEGASVFAWIQPSDSGLIGFPFELASSRAGTPAGLRPLVSLLLRPDARGKCRVPPLAAGEVDESEPWPDPPWASPQVLVEAAGYRSERRPLNAATVRVELAPVVEVRALVLDDAGSPISGARWECPPKDFGFGEADGHVLALVPRASDAPELVLDAYGFVARAIPIVPGGRASVDLGVVVLERAQMLCGQVVWPDGKPATPALVTAVGPTGKIVQGLTDAEGRFRLEPPEPGEFRIDAGTPAGVMRGSGRKQLWVSPERAVFAPSETRLELRYVPAVLVEFTGPKPRPPGFHWDTVVVVARSADGRAEYDWLPEGPRRRVVRLYGRGPWTLVARHAAIETVELELGSPTLEPDDPLPVYRIELRTAADPPPDAERRAGPR